ncbi:hypothetical protein C1645_871098 [Glomus cerebriforme]|uniref:F-box domain-containing protein n=1 Tax=Glomus cerebriforme TaxID=658196 RepID=A0A397TI00_9GLOM|nr:hypothetical protein C1645_871098 [Glomus cerebriforme]
MSQLLADCLDEIFEYLEDDMTNLHSCLLVNRLWCEISVKIFWRSVLNYCTSNFRTLIACLPNESKEILNRNGINISTPTSKPPIFKYASFCKILSIYRFHYKLELFLKDQRTISLQNLNNNAYIITQEIFKLYFNQIGSLKKLDLWQYPNIIFNFYPGAKDCLKNLTELHCSSNFSSDFFYQLSKICHNILSLDITVVQVISNGLTDLISCQKNLRSFSITQFDELTNTVPLLMLKLPNTLIKLNIYGENYISLSLIAKFTNLQELNLLCNYNEDFIDFEKLQFAIFPKLQVLKIQRACPKYDLLIRFLENGKNLKEFYVGDDEGYSDNSLNLAIAKFCPNLRKLSVGFKNNELESLKIVLKSCQYLESIKIWCGGEFLSEKDALEMFVNYSNKNTYEIILYHLYYTRSELLPEDLESFFISWSNRVPQKPLSLIIVNYGANSLDTNNENMKIIEKYVKLGVIKRFKVTDFDYEEFIY